MSATITRSIKETMVFNVIECASCGIPFAITAEFEKRRREDHKDFYCPNGHSLVFNGPSESERRAKEAEKRAERLERQVQAEKDRVQFWRDEHDATKRSLTATKGQLTKTKKRVANGVCPCCKRNFPSLARHMKTEHPDYVHEDGES